MWYQCTLTQMFKNKTDSKERKWNSHILLWGIENGTITLENYLAVSCKVNHTFIIWSGNPITWYLSNWKENRCSQKNLYANVFGGFTYYFSRARKHPNVLWLVNGLKKLLYLYNEQLSSNKKDPTSGIHNNVDESRMYCMLNKKSQIQRLHIIWHSNKGRTIGGKHK